MRRNRKEVLLAVLAVALVLTLSIVYASVFAYMPIQVDLAPAPPPVYFTEGSNANENDLGPDNEIDVTLGENRTSFSITIHPTYWVTYYKNVTVVVNSDTKVYHLYFRVEEPLTPLSGSEAKVCVYSANADRSLSGWPKPTPTDYLLCVDLTQTSTTDEALTLYGGEWIEIDVYVYIPEGVELPADPLTARLFLVYTPTSETPP